MVNPNAETVADIDSGHFITDDGGIQVEGMVNQLDSEKLENMDECTVFIVDSSPTTERKGMTAYKVQNLNGDTFTAEIPDIFQYASGNAVYDEHIYNHRCVECGKEKFYDQKSGENYCPIHD